MRTEILAGALSALAFCTPNLAIAASETPTSSLQTAHSTQYEVGALHVEQIGTSGAPLIFIPGLASGSWTWTREAQRLAHNHTVYLLTLPGFDGRPAVAEATLQSLLGDLRRLIEERRIDKPVIAGHSLGGVMALSFAIAHGSLLQGVISVDGLPVLPGTEAATGDRSALAQAARAQIESQTPEQFAAYEQAYMRQVGLLDPAAAEELAARAARSDVRTVSRIAAEIIELDLRPQLSAIRVPVVEIAPFNAPDLARAGIDEAGKVAYYRQLLQGVEQLEVLAVSPARHFAMFDQPEKFAAAMDAALDSLRTAGKKR